MKVQIQEVEYSMKEIVEKMCFAQKLNILLHFENGDF